MSTEVLEEADNAATEDVPAVILTLVDGTIVARCQGAADVLWFCRKVVAAHEVPEVRTVN